MKRPAPEIRDLARHILDHEIDGRHTPTELVAAIEGAFQRFHMHMLNLVGRAGFQALMARAAHLTKAEPGSHWIDSAAIQFDPAFTWKGLAESIESEGVVKVKDAAVVLLANVIGLLCTFIGEELTLLCIRRIWKEVPRAEPGAGPKEGR